jgi:phage-related protein
VDQQAMLTSHNDGGLVIGIMLGEVTKSAQDLRRLIGCKDIVSSPYLRYLEDSISI